VIFRRERRKPEDPWIGSDPEHVRVVLRERLAAEHPQFDLIARGLVEAGIATDDQALAFKDSVAQQIREESFVSQEPRDPGKPEWP
jgi:hypothetical protein